MHFSRQLAAFVRAGIPMVEALEVIEEETDDKTLRDGAPGSSGVADHRGHLLGRRSAVRDALPEFYLGMVRAAELTGQLDDVLDELSDYIERDLEARNKIKSALIYPLVILVMSIVTVVVLVDLRAAAVQGLLRRLRRRAAAADADAVSFTDFVSN